MTLQFTDTFSITGIALGTIVAIVFYHLLRVWAPSHLRLEPAAEGRSYEGGAMISTGSVETEEGEVSPFRQD